MGFPISFPEDYKVIKLYQGAANAVACDVVCMKDYHKGWFLISHNGSTDTDLVLTLTEATDVAAGTNAAVTKAQRLWRDVDAGTSSDTLAATTAAYELTIDPATQGTGLWLWEWDPDCHTDGYDCIYLADSGGNASDTVVILFIAAPRYKGASLGSGIVD